jgi:hypothetical protein
MDVREETSAEIGMQQCHKGPIPGTAATSRKQEGIQQDCQEDFWTGDHEVSSWDFQQVAKSEYQENMKEWAPSKMKEEHTSSFRIGAVD